MRRWLIEYLIWKWKLLRARRAAVADECWRFDTLSPAPRICWL